MKSLLTSFYFIPLAFLAALNFPANAQTNTFSYTGTIQTYTIPAGTTSISIGVEGGSGGGAIGAVPPEAIGGYGAVMSGVFAVTPGQVLKVLVGGAGQTVTYCGGGGGGSFVWDSATHALLIAAGGGGGAGRNTTTATPINGLNANTGTIAINGNTMPTGAGSGGTGGVYDGAYDYGAAGAGWLSSGAGGYNAASCSNATSGATPFAGGTAGAYGGTAGEDGNGGFGGGGGGQGRCLGAGAGGGGGYSGGGAGGELTAGNGIYQSGGGGGSYNLGSDEDNSIATDTGNGAAEIRICPSSITSTAGESICIGGTITLSSNATDGVWSGYGGVNVTPAGVVTGASAGTGVVTYKVPNCPGYSITVTINPSPRTGTIAGTDNTCIGLTANLIESVTGGTWTSSSTAVANISAAGVVTGVSAGSVDVTYTVTDATTGCSNFVLFPFMVTGPCPSGVSAVANRGAGLVYPNPNPGTFQVLISTVQDEQATVTISNVVGEKIKVFSATTNKETPIELNVPAGMYFINATTNDNRWTAKVMVTD